MSVDCNLCGNCSLRVNVSGHSSSFKFRQFDVLSTYSYVVKVDMGIDPGTCDVEAANSTLLF